MPRGVDPTSDRPLYRQIADQLKRAIQEGRYDTDTPLPSENVLADTYDVTRTTARQAIDVLKSEGLVHGERGKGVFVTQKPKVRRLARNRQAQEAREQGRGAFDADMHELGKASRVEFDRLEQTEPPSEIRERLGLDAQEQVLIRARRMYGDDEPLQLATSFVPWSLAEGTQMVEEDTGPGGLYSRLADANHAPVRFSEEIAVRNAEDRERSFFQIGTSQPVFLVTRTAYEQSGRAVEINEMVLPADRWHLLYDWDA